MGDHETTHRMKRAELLVLLHEVLEHDLVTAKISAPRLDGVVRDHAELDRETAVVAAPPPPPWRQMAIGFVVALIAGFTLTFSIALVARDATSHAQRYSTALTPSPGSYVNSTR
jgi:hypothetical protein